MASTIFGVSPHNPPFLNTYDKLSMFQGIDGPALTKFLGIENEQLGLRNALLRLASQIQARGGHQAGVILAQALAATEQRYGRY